VDRCRGVVVGFIVVLLVNFLLVQLFLPEQTTSGSTCRTRSSSKQVMASNVLDVSSPSSRAPSTSPSRIRLTSRTLQVLADGNAQFADPVWRRARELRRTSDELSLVSYRRVKPADLGLLATAFGTAPTRSFCTAGSSVRGCDRGPNPNEMLRLARRARGRRDQPRPHRGVAGGSLERAFVGEVRMSSPCTYQRKPGGTQQIFIAVSRLLPGAAMSFQLDTRETFEMTITSPVTGARLHLRAVPARVPFGAQS